MTPGRFNSVCFNERVQKYIPRKTIDWLAPIALGLGASAIIVGRTAGNSLSDSNCSDTYWTQNIQDVVLLLAAVSVLASFLNVTFRIKRGNRTQNIIAVLVFVFCVIFACTSWFVATYCAGLNA
jgi:amino acid transporter